MKHILTDHTVLLLRPLVQINLFELIEGQVACFYKKQATCPSEWRFLANSKNHHKT